MDDGSKVAAAILAAEASRQKRALVPEIIRDKGYNISGEILAYYRHFLAEIEKNSDQ